MIRSSPRCVIVHDESALCAWTGWSVASATLATGTLSLQHTVHCTVYSTVATEVPSQMDDDRPAEDALTPGQWSIGRCVKKRDYNNRVHIKFIDEVQNRGILILRRNSNIYT
jgi:hypothetical protein